MGRNREVVAQQQHCPGSAKGFEANTTKTGEGVIPAPPQQYSSLKPASLARRHVSTFEAGLPGWWRRRWRRAEQELGRREPVPPPRECSQATAGGDDGLVPSAGGAWPARADRRHEQPQVRSRSTSTTTPTSAAACLVLVGCLHGGKLVGSWGGVLEIPGVSLTWPYLCGLHMYDTALSLHGRILEPAIVLCGNVCVPTTSSYGCWRCPVQHVWQRGRKAWGSPSHHACPHSLP